MKEVIQNLDELLNNSRSDIDRTSVDAVKRFIVYASDFGLSPESYGITPDGVAIVLYDFSDKKGATITPEPRSRGTKFTLQALDSTKDDDAFWVNARNVKMSTALERLIAFRDA